MIMLVLKSLDRKIDFGKMRGENPGHHLKILCGYKRSLDLDVLICKYKNAGLKTEA